MTERNQLLDIIKGVLIIIVVFGHAIQVVHGGVGDGLHDFIRGFQMELFFVLSGVLAAYSADKAPQQRIKRCFQRLGIPYLSWVLSVLLLRILFGHVGFSWEKILDVLLNSCFWFFRVLLVIQLTKEAFLFICNKFHWTWALMVMIGIVYGVSQVESTSSVPHYLAYFSVGYLLSARTYTWHFSSNTLIARALVWCGRNSLGIYAVHWNLFFVIATQHVYNPHNISVMGINEYVAAGAVTITWMVATILIICAMKRNEFLKVMYLGEYGCGDAAVDGGARRK